MKAKPMTEAEAEAWGDAEVAARLLYRNHRTPEGLAQAQKDAEARRRAAGLSRNEATELVIEANRRKSLAAYKNRKSKK